jgi:tRNA(Ile)-lysidine synthase
MVDTKRYAHKQLRARAQMLPDSSLVNRITLALAQTSSFRGRFGVAVSGGIDSSMLAVHACHWARAHYVTLHLFHVHHGLQIEADEWQHRVHDLAHQLQVPCHSVRIRVEPASGKGVEAAAREARYRALARLAEKAQVSHMLLGHHQDDQAETVLLRLLRGAGPHGLAAMSPLSVRHGLCLIRPWLDVPRKTLEALANEYAARTGWYPVADPSNQEDLYTRSALRNRLVPSLDDRWPAWRTNVVRHARQSAEAREILQEVALNDFEWLEPSADKTSFSLAKWRALSPARQAHVLRYWLDSPGLLMPSEARLRELMKQLRNLHALGHDRQMRLQHANHIISCEKGRVTLLG